MVRLVFHLVVPDVELGAPYEPSTSSDAGSSSVYNISNASDESLQTDPLEPAERTDQGVATNNAWRHGTLVCTERAQVEDRQC